MNDEKLKLTMVEYGADVKGILDRFSDDMELYRSCMEQFFNDGSLEQLGKALKEKDYKTAFETAHGFKGLCGNMGLTPLYKAVCNIVEPLRNGAYDELDPLYSKIFSEYHIVEQHFLPVISD